MNKHLRITALVILGCLPAGALSATERYDAPPAKLCLETARQLTAVNRGVTNSTIAKIERQTLTIENHELELLRRLTPTEPNPALFTKALNLQAKVNAQRLIIVKILEAGFDPGPPPFNRLKALPAARALPTLRRPAIAAWKQIGLHVCSI